jgi:2,4-dienoyl-CoA reductase-like NADH-dependent reductase (Old Yellow Enzyme family)
VPLILVGGIRSPEVAERLVEEGTTDYVAMSRPLICEPDLVNRWKNGDTTKSACVSDNRCFNLCAPEQK